MSLAPGDYADRLPALLLSPDEAIAMPAPAQKLAAVLVPLYPDAGRLVGVFTKRNADLRRHAGEISFPGGRRDGGEDLRTTALREAHEEIGLEPDAVRMVGALPPVSTIVTNYAIYPFVGLIEPGGAFRPNPEEVDAIVELALPDLLAGFAKRRLIRRGVPVKTDTYSVSGNFIWGATARILGQLLGRLEPVL
jgi:8-oxo-dGTP pyrophosphatase MutT (NUDIX family)